MSVANTLGYEGYPLPVGTIIPFIGQTLPSAVETGVIVCDGSYYSPTEWGDLFEAIGYEYGRNGDNFRVPALSTANNSFLTGAAITNATRQTGSVVLEAPAGRVLTAANIPSFSAKADGIDSFTISTSPSTYVRFSTAFQSAQLGSTPAGPLIAAQGVENTGTSTAVTLGNTLDWINGSPAPLPDTQYTVTGTFNPQYVSVVYLIKARYRLPPLIGASTPNVPPPTSNIYNQNVNLSGFTQFGGAIQYAYY